MARGEECGRRKGRRKGRGAGGASREANVRHFFQGAIRSEAACVAPAWKGQPALRRGAPIRPSVDESIRLEDGPFVGAKRKADLAPSSKSRSLVCQTHDDTRCPTVRRRDAFPAARHLPASRAMLPSPRAIGRDERARRAPRDASEGPAPPSPEPRGGKGGVVPPTSADALRGGGRVAVGDAVVVGGRERHPGQARVVRVQAPGGGQLVLARRPQRGGRVRRPRARAGEDTAQGDRCAPHPTSFRDRPATRSRDLEGSPSRAASSVVHRATRSLTPSHAHPLYA